MAQAARELDEAREKAAEIVSAAQARAARVRAESDREVAAASQRRDSINAQLTNVRQMLATLSGTGPAPVHAEPEPVAAAAEPHPTEPEPIVETNVQTTDDQAEAEADVDDPATDEDDASEVTDDAEVDQPAR